LIYKLNFLPLLEIDGTPRKLLDVSRLNAMGWKSKIKLEDGLKSVYEWYLGNMRTD